MTPTAEKTITIVGGGLAGLVAAVACAEAGSRVELHEARAALGGRARSSDGEWVANFGPHGLCSSRPYWDWLKDRGLLPETAWIGPSESRFHYRGQVRRLAPLQTLKLLPQARRSAPADVSFHDWGRRVLGHHAAWVASRLAAATFAYHHDPGELAADFVWERIKWLLIPPSVHRVVGGWGVLVEELARHAGELGVRIRCGSHVEELPRPPVIVALPLSETAKLVKKDLSWTSGRGVAFDLGLTAQRRDPPSILDLDEGTLIQAQPETSSPAGHRLYQIHCGSRPDESAEETQARIEQVLDHAFADWRSRIAWKRSLVIRGCTGALDQPGTTWKDRPAIIQGDGVFIAGDMVAAPGVLSEVCYGSGQHAAREAIGWLDQREQRDIGRVSDV